MVNPLSPTPRAEKPVAWLWIQMILDSAAWILALWVAVLLRFELNVELVSVGGLVITCAVAVVLQLLVIGVLIAAVVTPRGRASVPARRPACPDHCSG